MYYTKEKADSLTDQMGDPIPYHKMAERTTKTKKVFVLSKEDIESLFKLLDTNNIPMTNGSFVIQADSKDFTRKPVYIRVTVREDNNLQLDYFHPNFPTGQILTTFLHLVPGGKEWECDYFNAVRFDTLKVFPENKDEFVEMQERNAEVIRMTVLALLYALQEDRKNFQKRGEKLYLKRAVIEAKLKTFRDIEPYVKTVTGKDGKRKEVTVAGYRRYLKRPSVS